jgi:VWFA-related protein
VASGFYSGEDWILAMMECRYEFVRKVLAVLVCCSMMAPEAVLAQQARSGESGVTFRVTSELVLVSVTVRDKKGELVRGLKQSDFTVLEDGKPQHLQSFDIEDVESYVQNASQGGPTQVEAAATKTDLLTNKKAPSREVLRDRRLMVLFLDLSSLQSDDSDRAVESAKNFLAKQMTPADLVSIVTFDTSLKVQQDFSSDKKLLTAALDRIAGNEGSGQEAGTTGTSEGTPEDSGSFVADDTDYNIFNTDLRLQALSTIAKNLAGIDQKKSILYFSSGMTKTGVENQAQLRAAVNAAVRSNVSIYAVDSRGLEAMPPGGGAGSASLRGVSSYSGAAVQNDLDSNFASQETLVTIANDTGGKAFLDSNDFSKAYAKVQADSETYYVLGYRSSNPNKDGRFRRIQVKLNRSDVKLEYRTGYYGPRDFQHFTKEDREEQLQEELMSDLPNTDLPVYLATGYFRTREGKFYVPVSIIVPSSALVTQRDKDKASLDVLGMVRDKETKFPVGNIRDNIQLTVEQTQSVTAGGSAPVADTAATLASAGTGAQPTPTPKRKNVQYNTSFLLPPGRYHLKFVVRENQNGRVGTFESDLAIPDLRKEKIKMSSVMLSSQKVPAGKKSQSNPLVSGGQEIVPNIAHVFTPEQSMTLYYEVYDPAKWTEKKDSIHLLTNIEFFRGKVKVYETPMVEAQQMNATDRKAAAFQFEVPMKALNPGWYTCQVNVIDDAGAAFAFPRTQVLVRQ